jgi:hypothetical protein
MTHTQESKMTLYQQVYSQAPWSLRIDLKARKQRVQEGLESAKSFNEFLRYQLKVFKRAEELSELFNDLA